MTTSNIATAINAAHAKVESAKREGTRYAVEAGRLLTDAKATVLHGMWDGWIRENCSFSARTARAYVQVFQYIESNPSKRQRVADLSFRALSREARRPKEVPTPKVELTGQCIRFAAVWMAAPFSDRKGFLDELVQCGDITPSQYVGMMQAADKDRTSSFIKKIEQQFGRDGLTVLVESIPFGMMQKDAAAKLKKALTAHGL